MLFTLLFNDFKLKDELMLYFFITENFPRSTLRGASTRFRTSFRRRRIRDSPELAYFEEFDLPIQQRMKQYRVQVENKEK